MRHRLVMFCSELLRALLRAVGILIAIAGASGMAFAPVQALPFPAAFLIVGVLFIWLGRPQSRPDLVIRNWRYPICSSCGYDCRATPDRCPECGTVKITA
jgi:hypothetical protein